MSAAAEGWSPERVKRVERLKKSGLKYRQIGAELGCSKNAISSAVYRFLRDPRPRSEPVGRPPLRPVRIEVLAIVELVASDYGLRRGQLISPARDQRIVEPRQIAIYIARELTGAKFCELASVFDRHTSTIQASYEAARSRLLDVPRLRTLVELLMEQHRQGRPPAVSPRTEETAHVR